jgi:GNAT superfamily N-acetyltransferase
MTEDLHIIQACSGDLNRFIAMNIALGLPEDEDYFKTCFEKQDKGRLVALIGMADGQDVGYALLNWAPKYGLFKSLNIPEIQDLNVLKDLRQSGYGTQMIARCESLAKDKGFDDIGIGVGLNRSFGPAQRLYTKLGYRPDGQGISYDRKILEVGDMRPNDDQLCLMMVKAL